jgi:large subunit ribosomal protein L9
VAAGQWPATRATLATAPGVTPAPASSAAAAYPATTLAVRRAWLGRAPLLTPCERIRRDLRDHRTHDIEHPDHSASGRGSLKGAPQWPRQYSQAEEEGLPVLQGEGDRCRLQGHHPAPQVHLRPRQDPRPSGDRQLRPAPARRGHRRSRTPASRAAALHLDRLAERSETMKLILTQEVTGSGAGDVVEVKDGYGRNYLLPAWRRDPLDPRGEKTSRVDQKARSRGRSATRSTPTSSRASSRPAPVDVKVQGRLGGRPVRCRHPPPRSPRPSAGVVGEDVDRRTNRAGQPDQDARRPLGVGAPHCEVLPRPVALNVIPA